MSEHHRAELDRHFAWFEGKLPPRPARFVGWLRKPSSRLVRIPAAMLLIAGGIFSFLPVGALPVPGGAGVPLEPPPPCWEESQPVS